MNKYLPSFEIQRHGYVEMSPEVEKRLKRTGIMMILGYLTVTAITLVLWSVVACILYFVFKHVFFS